MPLPGALETAHATPVAEILEPIRQKHKLPAMAGAIVTEKGLVAIGAVGVRKAGTIVAVTTNDFWHIGSDTKAMTATMIGVLVQQGRLKWETSVGEVFSDATEPLRKVTLLHLLSHRAGLPANANWGYLDLTGRPVREQRRLALMSAKTESVPGEKYAYSNLGYVIAGAMAEEATATAWEDLMRKRVFVPLGMKSAGYGVVGADQPCGHTAQGKPVPPTADNPPVLGPAGRVHCTMVDWSKFIADLLRDLRGERALLPTEYYQKMITPSFGGDYALGWIVCERGWGGGKVLTHNGSNTMNYSVAWVAPKRGFAVLVCVNQGGDVAAKACDEAASALIRLHQSH